MDVIGVVLFCVIDLTLWSLVSTPDLIWATNDSSIIKHTKRTSARRGAWVQSFQSRRKRVEVVHNEDEVGFVKLIVIPGPPHLFEII